ncbi:hypothetical protein EDC04DRAFT_537238 [Pisolithus marmoratus]|nr:hypothetical protein EDC04DRAFT_537238 [Pisolithus marmoratus]
MSVNQFFKGLPLKSLSHGVITPIKLSAGQRMSMSSWCFAHNGPEEPFAKGLGQASAPIPHLPPKALCRLPGSWVIVFGTRTYQVKVEELAKEVAQESLRD